MMNSSESIREPSKEEMQNVNGGVLPIVAALASFATHHALRSVGQYYLFRALTAYAVYGGAAYFSNK